MQEPRDAIESAMKEMFASGSRQPDGTYLCPRCGGPLRAQMEDNPQSLFARVPVCPLCARSEKKQEAKGTPLPLMKWFIVSGQTPEDL